MHMRIRYDYSKGDGTIGMSRQVYNTPAGDVIIVIDKKNMTFEIVNTEHKALVSGGGTKNFIVLLRQAKRALVRLGYQFNGEERDRDFGIRPKQG